MELPGELWLLVAELTCDADAVRTIKSLNKWIYGEFKSYENLLKVKELVMLEGDCKKPRMCTVLLNGKLHGIYVSIYRRDHVVTIVKKNFYWGCLDGLAMCKEIRYYNKSTHVRVRYCPYKNKKRHGLCYDRRSHDFGVDLTINIYTSGTCLYRQECSDTNHDNLLFLGPTVMRVPCYEDDLVHYPSWHSYPEPSFADFF